MRRPPGGWGAPQKISHRRPCRRRPCRQPAKAKGLCMKHYARDKRKPVPIEFVQLRGWSLGTYRGKWIEIVGDGVCYCCGGPRVFGACPLSPESDRLGALGGSNETVGFGRSARSGTLRGEV